MASSRQIDENIEELKRIVKDVLATSPDGLPVNVLLDLVRQYNRSLCHSKTFGVKKLSDVFKQKAFADTVRIQSKGEETLLFLVCAGGLKKAKSGEVQLSQRHKNDRERRSSSTDQFSVKHRRETLVKEGRGASVKEGRKAPASEKSLQSSVDPKTNTSLPTDKLNKSNSYSHLKNTDRAKEIKPAPNNMNGQGSVPGPAGDWPTIDEQSRMPQNLHQWNPVPAALMNVGQPQGFGNVFYNSMYGPHDNPNQQSYMYDSHGQTSHDTHRQGSHDTNRQRSHDAQRQFSRETHRHSPYESHRQASSRLTKEQVDSVAKTCIAQLAESGTFVSVERIEKLALQTLQQPNIRSLGIDRVGAIEHLESVREHVRTLCKVNAYIEVAGLTLSISTLHDIGENMREFVPDKDSFENLKLGPLHKLPAIHRLFKFPVMEDTDVPEITTADVFTHLEQYLSKNNKWTDKVELEDFMNYLVKTYSVPTAFHLGVRIRSLALAIQMLKKAQRDAGGARRAVLELQMQEMKNGVRDAMHKFSSHIMQPSDDGGSEIRRHYSSSPPEQVIREIFGKFHLLLSMETPNTAAARSRHNRIEASIKNFLLTMQEDELARMLLHLAICISSLDLQAELCGKGKAITVDSSSSSSSSDDDSDTETAKTSHAKPISYPDVEKLVGSLKQYIERCLAQGSVTLEHLCRIEEKLLEEYSYTSFSEMGYRSFLWLLLNQAGARKVLEDHCGLSLGSGGAHKDAGQSSASHNDVTNTVQQALQAGVTEPSQVEFVLCDQFNVTEVRSLGFGSVERLVKLSRDHSQQRASHDHNMWFEVAVCSGTSTPNYRQQTVGVLGSQKHDVALACLFNCPLLENMADWSNWAMVFEPELGSLKSFVQKYGGIRQIYIDGGMRTVSSDVAGLEIEPGRILKIVTHSSTEEFSQALIDRDVRAVCGHLVSQIVSSHGVSHAPLALLANHLKAALFEMHADSDTPPSPGGPPDMQQTDSVVASSSAVKFILDCLIMVPFRICTKVANQVFLDTIGQVVGVTKSKTLLLKEAQDCSDLSSVSRLHHLSCALGVHEWTTDFQRRLHLATCMAASAADDELGFDKSDNIWVEEVFVEDDSDDKDGADDECILLSDDEDSVAKATATDVKLEVTEEGVKLEKVGDDDEDGDADAIVGPEKQDTGVDKELENVQVTDEEGGVKVESGDEDEESNETSEQAENEDENQVTIIVDPCRDLIETIRRDEFGEGVELSPDAQKLMTVQHERLGRTLERLSRDLYSKDTHFVLELVQNADDNPYPAELLTNASANVIDDDEKINCAAVHFVMARDRIELWNNESGFQNENIKAICDVGRTTKGKHKYGYIGQKGIGFKSVFRVTDCPQVHSNGFHIGFDVRRGPMGYILPEWLEEDASETNGVDGQAEELPAKKPESESWRTRIILPLKSDVNHRHLAAHFSDLHPSLLLFLHRLRRIVVDNKVEQSIHIMQRRDLDNNVTEIVHNRDGHTVTDRWLVIRKLIDASQISMQAKSNIDVESTELALAFPMPASLTQTTQLTIVKLPVFAFLPLRSYGFRFIVQGDFEVPSSRECVTHDCAWNQWLRCEIPNIFIEALDTFKRYSEFTSVQAVCMYLQFVPLEDEIMDFFKPVASQILQKLRGKACLPSSPNSKGQIAWRKPSQLVTTPNALVREVVTAERLEQHLGLSYVHTGVQATVSTGLLISLGVTSITTQHLLSMGQSLVQPAEHNTDPTSHIHLISKWLACIYRSLDELHGPSDEALATLKALRFLPLSSEHFVSLNDQTVFLPLEYSGDQSTRIQRGLDVLEQDLCTVDSRLLDTGDAAIDTHARRLLTWLGLKSLSPRDVIQHHILPTLSSDKYQDKPRNLLAVYLIFLKDVMEREPHIIPWEELKQVAQVVTNHGILNPLQVAVHFTPLYGNELDLSQQLPGYDWVLLDACYLGGQRHSPAEIQSWREFFLKLGVIDFLDIRKKCVKLETDTLSQSPWSTLKDIWPESASGYTVDDFTCIEFERLVTANRNPASFLQQMELICEQIDIQWDTYYSKYTKAQLCDGNDSRLCDTASSFGIHLRQLSWLRGLRTKVFLEGEMVQTRQEHVLVRPNQLYIHERALFDLLNHTVVYASHSFRARSTFLEWLGIKRSVDIQTVKQILIDWSKREEGKPQQHGGASDPLPTTFCTAVKHIHNVYRYLRDHLAQKELKDLFYEHPVIFVPMNSLLTVNPVDDAIVPGLMLSRSEVWWHDPTNLFNKYRKSLLEYRCAFGEKRSLDKVHAPVEDLFTFHGAHVQYSPSLEQYAQLLLHLVSTQTLSGNKGLLTDVKTLLHLIGQRQYTEAEQAQGHPTKQFIFDQDKEKMLKILRNHSVWLTHRREWVGVEQNPVIADNPQLQRMFEDKPQVHFLSPDLLQIGSAARNQRAARARAVVLPDWLQVLLDLCGIKPLSACIQTTEVTEMSEPCRELQMYMHRLTPHVQAYLIAQYEDIFRKQVTLGIVAKLRALVFMKVMKLEVVYYVKHCPEATVARTEKCLQKDNAFYFHEQHTKSYVDINREIARFFSAGDDECFKDLRNYLAELGDLLLCEFPSIARLHELLERHEVGAIPEGEELWEVSPPVYIPPPRLPTPPPLPPPRPEQPPSTGEAGAAAAAASSRDGLKCWPPRSTDVRANALPSLNQHPKLGQSTLPSTLWPPPEAPSYGEDIRKLPAGFQFKRPADPDSHPGTGSAGSGGSDSQHSQHGDRGSGGPAVGSSHPAGQPASSRQGGGGGHGIGERIEDRQEHSPDQNSDDPMRGRGSTSSSEHRPGESRAGLHQHDKDGQPGYQQAGNRPSGHGYSREHDHPEHSQIDSSSEESYDTPDEDLPGSPIGQKRQLSESTGFTPDAKRRTVDLQMDVPVWDLNIQSLAYDELACGAGLPPPIDFEGDPHTNVGLWGELLVLDYLEKQKARTPNMVEVIWSGKGSDKPYDFKVVWHRPNETAESCVYIEVKTTLLNDKESFPISAQELKLAFELGPKYQIFRVYNAGNIDRVRLVRIGDVALHLYRKNLKLYLVV